MGTGPVDAVCRSLNQLADVPNELMEFSVKSVTEGIDAIGEVTIRLRRDGSLYSGHSARHRCGGGRRDGLCERPESSWLLERQERHHCIRKRIPCCAGFQPGPINLTHVAQPMLPSRLPRAVQLMLLILLWLVLVLPPCFGW